MSGAAFIKWIRAGEHPLAKTLFKTAKAARAASMPVIPPIHKPLYITHCAIRDLWSDAKRTLWHTPLFQTRLTRPAKNLYLFAGLPYISGPLEISMGDNCRVSGQTAFSGRTANTNITPRLIIGSNCGIGWQVIIAVGKTVKIGNNARIAQKCYLAGYPGHPVDPVARAKGQPDTDDQVRDIILEEDVWLGTGCTINAGVTIGKGTIVAAGSTVTKSLPPMVLAGGAPAKIIRPLIMGEDVAQLSETLSPNLDEGAKSKDVKHDG